MNNTNWRDDLTWNCLFNETGCIENHDILAVNNTNITDLEFFGEKDLSMLESDGFPLDNENVISSVHISSPLTSFNDSTNEWRFGGPNWINLDITKAVNDFLQEQEIKAEEYLSLLLFIHGKIEYLANSTDEVIFYCIQL